MCRWRTWLILKGLRGQLRSEEDDLLVEYVAGLGRPIRFALVRVREVLPKFLLPPHLSVFLSLFERCQIMAMDFLVLLGRPCNFNDNGAHKSQTRAACAELVPLGEVRGVPVLHGVIEERRDIESEVLQDLVGRESYLLIVLVCDSVL